MSDTDVSNLVNELRVLNDRLADMPTILEALDGIRNQLNTIGTNLGGYEVDGETVPSVVTLLQIISASLRDVSPDVFQMKLALGGYVEGGVLQSGPILERLDELNTTLQSIDSGIQLLDS